MSECASDEEIAKILRLPEGKAGVEHFHKMLTDLGSELTNSEKIFILLYTNPLSKLCGKITQSSKKAGMSKNMGLWYLQKPAVKKIIADLQDKALLDEIKNALTEDARRCMRILNVDRSEYHKDTEFTFTPPGKDEPITIEKVKDKCIYELTDVQREAIADYAYDKNGDAHPVIEKRSEARAALQNYQKLYGHVEENKTTETVVTLEGIRDKAITKISIIQHNNEDAVRAGEFIETMSDLDEEA